MSDFFTISGDLGPLVATAVHDGHAVRESLHPYLHLDEPGRLREEDPFTGTWVAVGDTRIVGHHSRFEVDLNRPPERAVYRTPDDAWGLHVYEDLPDEEAEASMVRYHQFYDAVRARLQSIQERFGSFVVYDLHTYNHRRDGADAPPADPEANPEVNIGTGSLDRARWGQVADQFMVDLKTFDFNGRNLDVRENVKFRGGHFSRWIHREFPGVSCVLAVEFKKFFMDEWTGRPDPAQVDLILRALRSTVPGVRAAHEEVAERHRELRPA
ncbi:MAG: N-formylglutamate amidohydrolase [Catalinimonas sp.]